VLSPAAASVRQAICRQMALTRPLYTCCRVAPGDTSRVDDHMACGAHQVGQLPDLLLDSVRGVAPLSPPLPPQCSGMKPGLNPRNKVCAGDKRLTSLALVKCPVVAFKIAQQREAHSSICGRYSILILNYCSYARCLAKAWGYDCSTVGSRAPSACCDHACPGTNVNSAWVTLHQNETLHTLVLNKKFLFLGRSRAQR
jgi:hypothetical protein